MKLKLEMEKQAWTPAEKLDVVLVAHVDEETDVEFLLAFGVNVKSVGDHYKRLVPGGLRNRMTLDPGTHRFPLSLDVPNGPFSYRGKSLGVFWYLVAESKIRGKEGPRVSVPIDLQFAPTSRPAPPPHYVTKPRTRIWRAGGSNVVPILRALGLVGFAFFIFMFLLVGVFDYWPMAIMAFLLVPLAFLFNHVMMGVMPEPELEPQLELVTEPSIVSPGERLTVYFKVTASEEMTIAPPNGTIRMIEVTKRTPGVMWHLRSDRHRRRTRRDYLPKSEQVLRAELDFGSDQVVLQPGESHVFASSIELPDDAPIAMELGHNKINWELEVEAAWNEGKLIGRQNLAVLPSPTSVDDDFNPVATEASVRHTGAMAMVYGQMEPDDDDEHVFDHADAEPELTDEPFVEEVQQPA